MTNLGGRGLSKLYFACQKKLERAFGGTSMLKGETTPNKHRSVRRRSVFIEKLCQRGGYATDHGMYRVRTTGMHPSALHEKSTKFTHKPNCLSSEKKEGERGRERNGS